MEGEVVNDLSDLRWIKLGHVLSAIHRIQQRLILEGIGCEWLPLAEYEFAGSFQNTDDLLG
jgi:hypothetical protein